ncbi:DnaB-like helicase C-terminal domain-containing protein [Deinococcus kurensis]|uniref:DnaB-like helicase C-terminal domain-containing protein n=1 Tax=Deinococcus kurensis TaxID=2662757 RepID=UPI0012D361C9|nr:DnaB-like helicase C-terminal domain-containing protein [Deinococcus kurensis]
MSAGVALERALVRTAFVHPKARNKLRKVPRTAWDDHVARDIALRLVSHQPVLDEHLAALGPQVLELGMVEAAVGEIVNRSFVRESEVYAGRIQAAAHLGDLDALRAAMDDRPSAVGMGGSEHISEIVHSLVTMAAAAAEGSSDQGNIPIPFRKWNDAWGGLAKGSLHVIGADPGGAKSAVVEMMDLAITKPGAGRQVRGGVMSMEMPREFKLARYAQHLYGDRVGPRALMAGKADMALLQQAMRELSEYGLFIDDTKYQRYGLIDAMHAMRDEHAIDYFTVDFLQLMQAYRGESKYDNMSNAIMDIYGFARESGCPVVVLSQLNREGRKLAERPRMTDLEGAGAIEQVAWTVNFLWDKDRISATQGSNGRIWVIDKNRNGPAPVELGQFAFDGDTMNLQIK